MTDRSFPVPELPFASPPYEYDAETLPAAWRKHPFSCEDAVLELEHARRTYLSIGGHPRGRNHDGPWFWYKMSRVRVRLEGRIVLTCLASAFASNDLTLEDLLWTIDASPLPLEHVILALTDAEPAGRHAPAPAGTTVVLQHLWMDPAVIHPELLESAVCSLRLKLSHPHENSVLDLLTLQVLDTPDRTPTFLPLLPGGVEVCRRGEAEPAIVLRHRTAPTLAQVMAYAEPDPAPTASAFRDQAELATIH
ncbi:hypothetical protein [Parvularcula dongshanensis]|uniref:Uncharacterized protein n=1 Tax=Parvularcula dongshanensis TaxID=1173995 RepID=A0A840I6U7_9PROT|nr:hypothetical protein [Parvularcula dongshanensis]MBB4660202.1 hypothetical protein [Parvularcula dongshanensis]